MEWIDAKKNPPVGKMILALLSKDFCGIEACVSFLHFCKGYGIQHPSGFYDEGGENVPDGAIEYWFPVPPIQKR